MSYKILAFIAIIFVIGVSCRRKQKQENPDTLVTGIISIAVDENLRYIMDAQIDAFFHRYRKAFVFPQYVTEKQAIEYLIRDSIKLAITGRKLDTYERTLFPKNRILREYPFGYEGIAFIINNNLVDTVMSVAQIKKMMLGKIATWRDLNPKSSTDTIKIFFTSSNNGVMRYVADSITGTTQNVSKHIYSLSNGENIFNKVSENINNIGIIGFNQMGNINSKRFVENSQKVKFLRISKHDNSPVEESYMPYAGDLYNGNYPFWRPLYVLLAETRDGLPTGLCFFLTQQVGQKIMQKAGLMPVTDAHKVATRWIDGY